MTYLFSLPEVWQYVSEHLSTPIFWLLGGFLILNGRWVNQQLERFKELESQLFGPDDTPIINNEPLILMTPTWFWLFPHLTSPFRRAVVVFLALCIFPLQLIEGWGVFNTMSRVTAVMLYDSWDNDLPFLFSGILCLLGVLAVIVACYPLGRAAAFLVKVQFWFVLRMWTIVPEPWPPQIEINEGVVLGQFARNVSLITENDLEKTGSQTADAKAP